MEWHTHQSLLESEVTKSHRETALSRTSPAASSSRMSRYSCVFGEGSSKAAPPDSAAWSCLINSARASRGSNNLKICCCASPPSSDKIVCAALISSSSAEKIAYLSGGLLVDGLLWC